MPLPMVHLYMARRMQAYLKKDFGDYFYLGSISPDAIHTRVGTNRKDKHKTHFFETVHNEENFLHTTKKNISELIRKINQNENDDFRFFGFGYSIHAILDMLWIRKIFYPLDRELRNGGLNFDDVRRLYYEETKACDFILYNNNLWMDDVLTRLEKLTEFDFYDLLNREEIRAWKNIVIKKIRQPEGKYFVEPAYIKSDKIISFIDSLVPETAALIPS